MNKPAAKRCPTCKSLEGQPGEVEPPPQVREQVRHFIPDGSRLVYRCRACGAEWERFVPAEPVGAESGSWKPLRIHE